MNDRITFKFDGKPYSIIADEADTVTAIVLPDGRPVKPIGWIETLPPQFSGVRAASWSEFGDKQFIATVARSEEPADVRTRALAKLTAEEREALGLSAVSAVEVGKAQRKDGPQAECG